MGGDGLVFLSSTGVNATIRRSDGTERKLGPFGWLGKDEDVVGVEEERREGGLELRAKLGEEENGFVFLWSEMESLCLEVEGVSLRFVKNRGELIEFEVN